MNKNKQYVLLGMTCFYDHPNDGLYDTIDYVIEGIKAL